MKYLKFGIAFLIGTAQGLWRGVIAGYREYRQIQDAYEVGEPVTPAPTSDFQVWADWEDGQWVAPCWSCSKSTPIECEPWEFDHMSHYCGGSPSCCP